MSQISCGGFKGLHSRLFVDAKNNIFIQILNIYFTIKMHFSYKKTTKYNVNSKIYNIQKYLTISSQSWEQTRTLHNKYYDSYCL